MGFHVLSTTVWNRVEADGRIAVGYSVRIVHDCINLPLDFPDARVPDLGDQVQLDSIGRLPRNLPSSQQDEGAATARGAQDS